MATIVTRAGKGSPLTNAEVDANFTNLNTELGTKANTASLAAVATSGSYADLTGKPTNVSFWTNDAGYISGINSSMVTTALGYTPYNASNPAGYITSSGSITGNAATANHANTAARAVIYDTRAGLLSPNDYADYAAFFEFTNQIVGADWHSAMTMQGWHDGYAAWQIIGPSSTTAHENFYLRSGNLTTWNTPRRIWHSGDATISASADFRAPIFYDSNNTSYYVDAASNSILENIDVRGTSAYWSGHSYTNTYDGYNVYQHIGGASSTDKTWHLRVFRADNSYATFNFAGNGSYGLAEGSWRAPIFYDSNNTAFYTDPSSTSVLNAVNANALNGPSGSRIMDLDGSDYTVLRGPDSTIRSYIGRSGVPTYYDNSVQYFRTNGGAATAMSITDGGIVIASVDMRAQLFYDSNNTARYLDPAGNSMLGDITLGSSWLYMSYNGGDSLRMNSYGPGFDFFNQSQGTWADIRARHAGFQGNVVFPNTSNVGVVNAASDAWLWLDDAYGNFYARNGNGGFFADFTNYNFRSAASALWAYMDSGQFTHWGSLRAPLFLDSDDTSRYLDPAGSSVIQNLTVRGVASLQSSNDAQLYLNGDGTSWSGISWTDVSGTDYMFYNGATSTFAIGGGGSAVSGKKLHINGGVTIGSSMGGMAVSANGLLVESGVSAPIFYDSGNTNYYVDPAGTSVLYDARARSIQFTNGNTAILLANDTYNMLHDPAGHVSMYLGGTGDPGNYHDNASHHFRNRAGSTTYAWINAGGVYGSAFVDSADTAYYLDPAGPTNLNTLTLNGGSVFRSNWTTGFQSSSDFVDGTLVTTDIPASAWAGESFLIEITGKSYDASNPPFKVVAQGYLYSDTIINYTGINYGGTFSSYIKVFEEGGVLKFWWPRISYWNSFNVNVMAMDSATNGTISRNRVTAIANSTEPTGTKKQTITLARFMRGDVSATNSVDVRAPIFYDTDNTARFVDAAGTSVFNVVTAVGGINTNAAINLYDSPVVFTFTGALPFMDLQQSGVSGGINWRIRSGIEGVANGGFSIRDLTAGANRWSIDSGGSVTAYVDSRAPVFYDSNNTAYYVDGAGTSALWGLTTRTTIQSNDGTNSNAGTAAIAVFRAGWSGSGNYRHSIVTRHNGSGNEDNAWDFYLWRPEVSSGAEATHRAFIIDGSAGTTSTIASRAPIFYDTDDTGYYLNPSASSNIYSINVASQLVVGGDARAPIFYDSNNTGFYADPANISRLNVVDASEVYTYGWLRNRNSGNGVYNESTGQHFYSDSGNGWNIASGAGNNWLRFRSGGYAGSVNGYLYADSSNNIGFLNQAGSWSLQCTAGGNVTATGDFRAPIFYDSNNTGYYADPASTSYLNTLSTREAIGSGTAASFVYVEPTAYYYWTKIANVSGGDASASILITSKSDVNYVNFASALLTISAWNGTSASAKLEAISGCDLGMDVRIDNNNDVWLQVGSVWSSNLSWKVINKVGNPTVYYANPTQQTATPANSTSISYGQAMRGTQGAMSSAAVSNISNTIVGGLTARADVRAPVFYDSNDTNYYVDPSSTSNSAVRIRGGALFGSNPTWGAYLAVGTDGWASGSYGSVCVTNGNLHLDAASGYDMYLNNYAGNDTYIRYAGGDRLAIYGPGNYTAATGSLRAPLFYDSQNTGYFIDPSGNSVLNTFNVGGQEVYVYGSAPNELSIRTGGGGAYKYFRFDTSGNFSALNGSVYGLVFYDQDNSAYRVDPTGTSNLLNINANYIRSFSNIDVDNDLIVGTASGKTASYIYMKDGDHGDRIIHCNSNRIGFLTQGGGWGSFCEDDGSWTSEHSLRAPIFYDHNDTGYYVNPNGTSNLATLSVRDRINGSINGDSAALYSSTAANNGGLQYWNTLNNTTLNPTDGWWYGIRMAHGDADTYYNATLAISFFSDELYLRRKTGGADQPWRRFWHNGDSTITASGDFRAPIFYDSADTTFYLDPASTGTALITNGILVAGTGTSGGVQNRFFTGGRNRIWSFANSDTYGLSYFQGGPDYIGFHFGTATQAASRFWVSDGGIAQASGSLRAPIFYDSEDTFYFLDPNGFQSRIKGFGSVNSSSGPGFNVMGDGSNGAIMAFHRSGAYAINMGLDTDNVFRIGGWSAASNRLQLNMSGDLTVAGSARAPIFYDSDNTGFYVDPSSTGYSFYSPGKLVANGLQFDSYGSWNGGGAGGSAIVNESGTYNALMIVGNTAGGAERVVRMWDSVRVEGDHRAPIYYDYNNSSFYLDPNATGTSLNVAGSIVAAGNVTAYSDARVKTNVSRIDGALDKVGKIGGYTYTRTDLADTDRVYGGVIAQEIEKVLPEAIFDNGSLKSVDYNATIALLIEAIKELKSEVETLKATIH